MHEIEDTSFDRYDTISQNKKGGNNGKVKRMGRGKKGGFPE